MRFLLWGCGFFGLAHHIAAVKINRRDVFDQPIVVGDQAKAVFSDTELRRNELQATRL
jgi:hypothetical protein